MIEKQIKFKYRNSKIYNILALICFIICLIAIGIIIKTVNTNLYRIIYILLIFIFANILLSIISNNISITNGIFTFHKDKLTYETLNKEYTINYDEIEYIIKEQYMENGSLIKKENFQYIIKIKDAGTFTFKYYNDTLLTAIEELINTANLTIEE